MGSAQCGQHRRWPQGLSRPGDGGSSQAPVGPRKLPGGLGREKDETRDGPAAAWREAGMRLSKQAWSECGHRWREQPAPWGIKSAQGSGSALDGNQCFHFLLNPPSWVAHHAHNAEEVPEKAVDPTTQSP